MQDETSWKSKEAADHYVRVADALIPRRGEILSTISSLATALTPNSPRVLDLGCGNGDVTAAILEEAPEASVLMSDFSGEMVRLSSERFADNPRVAVVEHDLDDGLPPDTPDGTFHAVVSCFSLHHVEHGNRVGLYQEVRRVLRSEGVFVNGDRFTGDAHRVSTWEFDNWIKFMAEQIKVVFGKEKTLSELAHGQRESDRRLGDKPGSIWVMERDLREAGFQYVDCVWKYGNLAIMAAGD